MGAFLDCGVVHTQTWSTSRGRETSCFGGGGGGGGGGGDVPKWTCRGRCRRVVLLLCADFVACAELSDMVVIFGALRLHGSSEP